MEFSGSIQVKRTMENKDWPFYPYQWDVSLTLNGKECNPTKIFANAYEEWFWLKGDHPIRCPNAKRAVAESVGFYCRKLLISPKPNSWKRSFGLTTSCTLEIQCTKNTTGVMAFVAEA